MRQRCEHADQMQPVAGPLDVCEVCVVEGSRWVHLRQCLVSGETLCCDDSPRRHMSAHWRATGHAVMRNASPGEEWTWCFAHDAPIRPVDGGWQTFDAFTDAGTIAAAEHAAAGRPDPPPDYVTDDGFPLGDWVVYVREMHESGELGPEEAEAIEAIPGWRWSRAG
jgi:hypothetical protein